MEEIEWRYDKIDPNNPTFAASAVPLCWGNCSTCTRLSLHERNLSTYMCSLKQEVTFSSSLLEFRNNKTVPVIPAAFLSRTAKDSLHLTELRFKIPTARQALLHCHPCKKLPLPTPETSPYCSFSPPNTFLPCAGIKWAIIHFSHLGSPPDHNVQLHFQWISTWS